MAMKSTLIINAEAGTIDRVMPSGKVRQNIGSPQKCRMSGVHGIIEQGGWHLSYFGDTEFIRTKLVSFAHTEYSGGQYTSKTNIEDSVLNCKDLNCGRPFTRIPISANKNLPPDHELILKLFQYCHEHQ